MPEIIPIPAFADNYIWLLRDGVVAAIVDPGDAEPVIAFWNAPRLRPAPFSRPITMAITSAEMPRCSNDGGSPCSDRRAKKFPGARRPLPAETGSWCREST